MRKRIFISMFCALFVFTGLTIANATTGDTLVSQNIPTATPPPPDKLILKVKARKKTKRLVWRKKTVVVKGARTNGHLKKVRVQCILHGNVLKGKDRRSVCKTMIITHTNFVRVEAKAKCSVGLKIRAKIVAANNTSRTKWQRTWRVQKNPRCCCSLPGKV